MLVIVYCLSVSYNELMNPERAGTFYGLSVAASLVPKIGLGTSCGSVTLGVREKERMSEWVHSRVRRQTPYVLTLLYLEEMRNVSPRLCASPDLKAVTYHWLGSMDLSSLITLENSYWNISDKNHIPLTETLMRGRINKFLIRPSGRGYRDYLFRSLSYYNPTLAWGHLVSFLECCGEGNIFRKIFVLPDFTNENPFLIGTKSIRCLRMNISLPSQLLLWIGVHSGTGQVPRKDSDVEWKSFLFPWIGGTLLPMVIPRDSEMWVTNRVRIMDPTHTSCQTLGRSLNLCCQFSHLGNEDNGNMNLTGPWEN